MTSLHLLLLSIFVLYALTSLVLVFGARLSKRKSSRSNPHRHNLPHVSVLIPARNEETRLPHCLEALLRSDYPHEKLEILVLNDRSTDGTALIVERFSLCNPVVKPITLTRRLSGMSGKASTLCQGMEHAQGEIILVTDADCIVAPQWIRSMAEHFSPEVGVVGGFTILSPNAKLESQMKTDVRDSVFARIQSLDWMYLIAVGAGSAGLGKPVSVLGNNFAFRKKAYDEVGGYPAIGFTIIEDFALMRKIADDTEWRVALPIDPSTSVFTFPVKTWREFLDQRKRWAAGGKEVGALAKYYMVLAFCVHLALTSAAFLSAPLALCGLAIKLGVDFILLGRCARVLGRMDLMRSFLLFELYYFTYSFALAPVVALPAKVHWKGVHYQWDAKGNIKNIEESSLEEA